MRDWYASRFRTGLVDGCPRRWTVCGMDEETFEVSAGRVAFMRHEMEHARVAADRAAAAYRDSVREAVAGWRAGGASLRKCAARLRITEGSLRDLLRPAGAARRSGPVRRVAAEAPEQDAP